MVGDWAIADTTFEMNTGVPMRLADAEAHNSYRNNAFFVEQSYGIPLLPVTERDFSIAALPAVFVGHSASNTTPGAGFYSDKRAPYTDERGGRDEHGDFVPVTRDYYDNWYLNPTQTRDSTYERVISNRLFVQVQPWNRDGVVGTIDGGVGLDLHTWSQFAPGDYVSGRYAKTRKSSWFAYGAIDGKIRRYVDWGADVKFYPSGYRGGDLSFRRPPGPHGLHPPPSADPRRTFLDGPPLADLLAGALCIEPLHAGMRPRQGERNAPSKCVSRFPTSRSKRGPGRGVVNDKIYYGADARVAQKSGSVSLTSVYVRKDFRVGGFHFDHRVLPSVEHRPGCGARAAAERLPELLLRILGQARRAAAPGGIRRPLQYGVLCTRLQSGAGAVPTTSAKSKWETTPTWMRTSRRSGKRMRIFPQVPAPEQGALRQRTLLLGGALSADAGHVQNGYLVGIHD